MPRFHALHFRDVPGVHPDSRISLSPLANVLLGREAGALLAWLAAFRTGDFSQAPDAAWTVACTVEGDGGLDTCVVSREGAGAPILVRREADAASRCLEEGAIRPDATACRYGFTPTRDLLAEVGAGGTLRSWRWVPAALRTAHIVAHLSLPALPEGTEAAEAEARVGLREIPELAPLWYPLDYERGELVMAPSAAGEVGAVSFALVRADGAVVGAEALSPIQRRVLGLHYFLACQGHVALVDGVMSVVEGVGAGALQDVLRPLCAGRGARQSIFTAPDSRLLYALALRSAAAVQACAVLCLPEPTPGEGRLWRDMTDEEAQRYFVLYAQRVARIDDLIRLW